jgi:uncharacterized protein (TIGR03083 family)
VTAAHGPIQLIADEEPRLALELQRLPPAAWAAPSRCAGWSNAHVVGHLAFHAAVYRDSIARALRGDSTPPPGSDGQPLTREAFLSHADAQQVALANHVPEDVLRELSRAGDALTDVLKRLAPADLDRPVWHYTGTLTIGFLLAFRLYELAFHGWDVRSTVDPAAQIRPELCPFLVGTVRQLLPVLSAPDCSIQATCRFEVDGQTWTTHVGDGKVEEVMPAGEPDAIVRTDASTFLLLTTMRLPLSGCADRVTIEGARDPAELALSVSTIRV